MNKYYVAWGICAVVAYQKYKYYPYHPANAFGEAVFSFLVGAAFFTIILALFDLVKKHLFRCHRKNNAQSKHNHYFIFSSEKNENMRPIYKNKTQSQRMSEWEQACRDGQAEAQYKIAEHARRKIEEEKIRSEQARRRADEELARQRAEEARLRYEKEQTRKRAAEEQARRVAEEELKRKAIQKYFDIFELPFSATFDDVKKKYRIMIQLFHPDKYSSNEDVREYAEMKTKELNNAFEILKKYFEV